ncbi:MAG: hypothetical protein WCA32_22295 [Chromatiaceae bacterium]
MKRTLVTTTALAFLFAAGAPAFAAHKTPEQLCKEQATKEHVSKHKREAFIKSCVQKHEKSMSKKTTMEKKAPAGEKMPAGE